jgi:hypothetical protein
MHRCLPSSGLKECGYETALAKLGECNSLLSPALSYSMIFLFVQSIGGRQIFDKDLINI